jgi:phosphohistidine phosphatase
MNLYVLRHASAGVRRLNPLLDVKRPLDKEGKKHCLQLAHVLNAMKVSFDVVVSSPLKRSLQTAQLVATETGYEQKILISNALAPEATYAQFQRLLRECATYENLLVVGHNPNITQFLGQLVGGGEAGAARIRLRKGSLARVALQRDPATLQGLIDPRVVRALYATSIKSSRRKTSRK